MNCLPIISSQSWCKLSLPCAPQFISLGESLIRCFCLPSGKWQALLSSFSGNHYIYLGTFAFHFSYLCIWEPQMYFFSYLPGVDRNSRSCVASELWLMEAAGLETPAYNRPKWNCSTCNSTHSGNSHPERKSFLFSHFIDELLWCCCCGVFPLMLFPIVDSKEALFIPLLKIAVKENKWYSESYCHKFCLSVYSFNSYFYHAFPHKGLMEFSKTCKTQVFVNYLTSKLL